MSAAEAAHPGQRVALWFQDEARVGQKGRPCRRWWLRGRRPPGRCDQRFASAYLFAAVEPATGAEVALVLPEATTTAMNLFLAEFGRRLPADGHAVLVLDGAGWHGGGALKVPGNVTLVHLPPYAPELVWGFPCQALMSPLSPPFRRSTASRLPISFRRSEGSPPRARSVAPQPCMRSSPVRPDHDAAMRIGGEAPGRRAHSEPRLEKAMFRVGLPPPRIVIGGPARTRRRTTAVVRS